MLIFYTDFVLSLKDPVYYNKKLGPKLLGYKKVMSATFLNNFALFKKKQLEGAS